METDYVDLGSLLQQLRERKWFILSIGLAIFIFSMIYILAKPRQYQAVMLLQINQNQQGSLGNLPRTTRAANQENLSGDSIALQIALIRSRFILLPVIHSMGLDIDTTKSSLLPLVNRFGRNSAAIRVSELQVPLVYLDKALPLIAKGDNQYYLEDTHHQLLVHGRTGQLASKNGVTIKIDHLEAVVGTKFFVKKKPETDTFNHLLAKLAITDLTNSAENNNHRIGLIQVTLIGKNPALIANILNKIAVVMQQQ